MNNKVSKQMRFCRFFIAFNLKYYVPKVENRMNAVEKSFYDVKNSTSSMQIKTFFY